jgi:hypothetical protein
MTDSDGVEGGLGDRANHLPLLLFVEWVHARITDDRTFDSLGGDCRICS